MGVVRTIKEFLYDDRRLEVLGVDSTTRVSLLMCALSNFMVASNDITVRRFTYKDIANALDMRALLVYSELMDPRKSELRAVRRGVGQKEREPVAASERMRHNLAVSKTRQIMRAYANSLLHRRDASKDTSYQADANFMHSTINKTINAYQDQRPRGYPHIRGLTQLFQSRNHP